MKGIENIRIREDAGGVVIAVKVVPGASRDKVAGVLGDALKVTTSAAAEKGKANAAVAKIIAKAVGVDRRNVKLASGQTNPRKELRIAGASRAGVLDALRAV